MKKFLFLLLALSAPARAEFFSSGAELMKLCYIEGTDAEAVADFSWCVAYIRGFTEGVLLSQAMNRTHPVCLPAGSSTMLVMKEAWHLLLKRPDIGQQPPDQFLYVVLGHSFPCH